MDKWNGRIAVVVDFAGSATGLAICTDLVNAGMTVIALTKREEFCNLSKHAKSLTGKGELIPFEVDLREEATVNPLFRWIGDKYEGIDLLVCNANVMTKGLILEDENTSALRQIMQTNIIGLCWLLRESAKLFRLRPENRKNFGHVIVITSTVGQKVDGLVQTKPINALYPAIKHAAKAIVECVRQELIYNDDNVKITSISPGLVECDGITADLEDESLESLPTLKPEEVSQAVLYAITVKDHVQIQEIVLKPVGDFL